MTTNSPLRWIPFSSAVTDQTRMVYIANPENPAGTCIGGTEVRRTAPVLTRSRHAGSRLRIRGICRRRGLRTRAPLAGEADNVVVTHTFSKIYGLAGARVGWMYANPEIIDMVSRIGLTFPIATPSVAAATGRTHRSRASYSARCSKSIDACAVRFLRGDARARAQSLSKPDQFRADRIRAGSKIRSAAGCAESPESSAVFRCAVLLLRPTKIVFA